MLIMIPPPPKVYVMKQSILFRLCTHLYINFRELTSKEHGS